MRFANDSLQPGVPAFNMIVRSWPIVIEVIPLLESELAIDPGSVKVCDKVINFVHLWDFLLNTLPCYSNKTGETKQVAAVFCTKLFRIPLSDLYSSCSPKAWTFRQIAWE